MIKIITAGVLLAMALTTAACRTPESKIPDTVILEQKDSSDALTDETSPITGIWETASMGYEEDGTMYPEYHVEFTDSDIRYGHMKDGIFIQDHSDRISSIEEIRDGRYRIQAESSNGVQYTYQTSESDENVLEYYETWEEEEFPQMYRGGASLGRIAEDIKD